MSTTRVGAGYVGPTRFGTFSGQSELEFENLDYERYAYRLELYGVRTSGAGSEAIFLRTRAVGAGDYADGATDYDENAADWRGTNPGQIAGIRDAIALLRSLGEGANYRLRMTLNIDPEGGSAGSPTGRGAMLDWVLTYRDDDGNAAQVRGSAYRHANNTPDDAFIVYLNNGTFFDGRWALWAIPKG